MKERAGFLIWLGLALGRIYFAIQPSSVCVALPQVEVRRALVVEPVRRVAAAPLPPCEDDGADQREVAVGFRSCVQ
jgi:hypothetical protein